MVTKSFENSIMNTTPFSIFCDILLPTNRRTKKDASAVPHPILRILLIFIADRHSSSSNKRFTAATNETSFVRNSYKKNRFSENRFVHQFLQRLLRKSFGSSKRILVRISTRTRASPSLLSSYFFTSSHSSISFFFPFFLFNSFLYRCRARARKKMKNARFLLRSVCDRFLFRTSNVPLSFFFII